MPTLLIPPCRRSAAGRDFHRNAPCVVVECGAPAPNAYFCQSCIRTIERDDVPWTLMPYWHSEGAAARKADRVARGIHQTFRRRGLPELNLRAAATAFTKIAVANGFLADPRTCKCEDCGRQAECYDHRDYSQPMMVHPVCRVCNNRRGRGLMPDRVVDLSEQKAA